MSIQAVFFDMGGTIETYCYTTELRLQATPGIANRLSAAGIDLHLDNTQLCRLVTGGLARYHRWSLDTLVELPATLIWRDYILDGFIFDAQALDAIAEDLMTYYETHFYQREMRPEIPTVLQAIREKGWKIGVISNVRSRGQVPFNLERYRIRQYFDPVVLSSEYGRRKPDPAIFHYAARLANVPASQCAYIGDRIARDVVGARRAGYALAVQIHHDFDHGEEDNGAIPDAVIDQMTALLPILEAASRQASRPPAEAGVGANPLRAVLFDAGDILYFRPDRGSRLMQFLAEHSFRLSDDHLTQKEALSDQAYQGHITQDRYREELLRLYGVSQPDMIVRGKQILEAEDNDVHFFEGVAQTLAALKQKGYLLGIITDTTNPVHTKLKWFEKGGFGNLWDTIISSQEMGVRKPNPQIYQAALRQLDVAAGQAIFVGHKASELDGARAVGMRTVAFNYEPGAAADYYIDSFPALLDVPIVA